ncbi:hypothetical protein KEM56_005329 [Ascosphaera pollenicola]|nr:hypothetical protein KEM56_005329 [Ascosphaera pollenicola]
MDIASNITECSAFEISIKVAKSYTQAPVQSVFENVQQLDERRWARLCQTFCGDLLDLCIGWLPPHDQRIKGLRKAIVGNRPLAVPLIEALVSEDAQALQEAVRELFTQSSTSQQLLAPGASATASAAFRTQERHRPGAQSASSRLSSVLIDYSKRYTPGYYSAPYTAVVGPSGIGKGAAVRNIAISNTHYVSYVSLAKADSEAVPGRSKIIADQIDRWTTKEGLEGAKLRQYQVRQWMKFCLAVLVDVELCHDLKISPARFYEAQLGDESELYWENFVPSASCLTAETLRQSLFGASDYQKAQESLVVICIGEARFLLDSDQQSPFRSFGEAIAEVRSGYSNLFSVLLDNTPRICNFLSSASADSSMNFSRNPEKVKLLYPPIYALNTFDVWTQDHTFECLDLNPSVQSLKQFFSFGMPLWGALLHAGSQLGKVHDLAREKMKSDETKLNLISYIVDFRITSQAMNAEYVERHMRYIVSVDDSRQFLHTIQPSEPILADAALFSLAQTHHNDQLHALQALHAALSNGLVDVGDVGEMVAILILLFSYESALSRRDISIFHPITVERFFRTLFSNDFADNVYGKISGVPQLKMLWEKGLVLCNHFVRLYKEPTSIHLHAMFARGAGIILPANYPGIDLIMPIRFTDGDVTNMSCIAVQVKSKARDSANPAVVRSEAKDSLKAAGTICGNATFGIMMCLQEKYDRQEAAVLPVSDRNTRHPQAVILSHGFGSTIFPNVAFSDSASEDVYATLTKTLRWNWKPDETGLSKQEKEYLRPLVDYGIRSAIAGLCRQKDVLLEHTENSASVLALYPDQIHVNGFRRRVTADESLEAKLPMEKAVVAMKYVPFPQGGFPNNVTRFFNLTPVQDSESCDKRKRLRQHSPSDEEIVPGPRLLGTPLKPDTAEANPAAKEQDSSIDWMDAYKTLSATLSDLRAERQRASRLEEENRRLQMKMASMRLSLSGPES